MTTLDSITCPITGKIFNDPVVALDGYVYENTVIVDWFITSDLSPITKQPINKLLIKCHPMKQIVSDHLEKNPSDIQRQYQIPSYRQSKFNFYNLSMNYSENIHKVNELIDTKQFYSLLNYNSFDLHLMFKNKYIFKKLLKYLDITIWKHIIDNTTDLEVIHKRNSNSKFYKWRLIHYIIYYNKNLDIIRYLVSKIDVNCRIFNDDSLIHFVLLHSELEIIKHIASISNLECTNDLMWKPIHYAVRNGDFEVIKYIVSLGADINSCTTDGLTPIKLAAQLATMEVIKYLVEHGAKITDEIILIEYIMKNEKLNGDEKKQLIDPYKKDECYCVIS